MVSFNSRFIATWWVTSYSRATLSVSVAVMRSYAVAGHCRTFSVLLLVLASIASRSGPSDIKADPSDIKVTDAWIRWLPANLPGAGYMTLTNTGNATYTLVGAKSADYGEVSFHQTRNHDGMNEMTP